MSFQNCFKGELTICSVRNFSFSFLYLLE